MDELDNVNIFISEGAGVESIVKKEMEAAGEGSARRIRSRQNSMQSIPVHGSANNLPGCWMPKKY